MIYSRRKYAKICRKKICRPKSAGQNLQTKIGNRGRSECRNGCRAERFYLFKAEDNRRDADLSIYLNTTYDHRNVVLILVFTLARQKKDEDAEDDEENKAGP